MLLRRYSILTLVAALSFAAAVPVAAVCREDTLAKSSSTIKVITSDGTYVYFGTLNGQVQRVDVNTKAVTQLADATGFIGGITNDTTTVYFASEVTAGDGSSTKSTVYSIPKQGGTPALLAEVDGPVGEMATDSSALYWIIRSKGFTDATGKVQKIARTGGTVTTLAQNLAVPIDLYLDASNVYFTEDGLTHTPPYGLSKVAKTGGNVSKLYGTHPGADILTVEGGNVIFSAWEDGDHQGIYRVATTGGAATAIRTALPIPSHFEKAGDKIYYAAARYDLSNGAAGSLNVIEASGNLVTLSSNPFRTFTSDTVAIYALSGVTSGGRVERYCLNYATAPKIASFSGNGAPTGGTEVTITGERFATGAQVTFDDIAGSVISVSPTQIVVAVPAHPAGIVEVYVVNPNGESGKGSFYYDPALTPAIRRHRAIRR